MAVVAMVAVAVASYVVVPVKTGVGTGTCLVVGLAGGSIAGSCGHHCGRLSLFTQLAYPPAFPLLVSLAVQHLGKLMSLVPSSGDRLSPWLGSPSAASLAASRTRTTSALMSTAASASRVTLVASAR
jgi:hypothetical protein